MYPHSDLPNPQPRTLRGDAGGDESIFKSKEAKEKPCGNDEASMKNDEGAEARR